MLSLIARGAAAQTSPADTIDFDRPEAWAMKYFVSASALNGLSTPEPPPRGSVALELESGWLPTLSTSQQRVGFDGTSPEDLNKAPVLLRPRVTVGLPRTIAITAAVDPPMRAFGVTPRLFALAVDGPMFDSGGWRLRWRAHGQVGSVTAAVTCPPAVLRYAPGSAGNPAGCTGESSDETMLRYAGAEAIVSRAARRGWSPHAAVGVNFVDGVFQTNAPTYGQLDRTQLATHGAVLATSAGVGYVLNDRLTLIADAFFAPLTVRRQAGAPTTVDPMTNVRALVSYRVFR